MAPNLITLSGLSFVLINVTCIALYEPDLKTPGPTWLYLSFALGLFLYQTFDNVDGRQARKTGTSSPLGHVFDHGIDTLNCPLGGLVQVASLGLGHSVNGAFFVLIGCVPMWLVRSPIFDVKGFTKSNRALGKSTIRGLCTSVTSTVYQSILTAYRRIYQLVGPTEGILIAIGVHLISAFFGPGFWHTTVELSRLFPWVPRSVTLIECFNVIVLLAVFVAHAPVCFMNVHAACKSKGIPFVSAVSQNLSFAIYIGLCWFWVTSPYSSLLSPATDSVPSHGGLIEFTLLVVCTFGRMLPRVIIAHLTRGPFPALLPSVILPIVGGVAIVNLNRFGWHTAPAFEIWYTHAALVYSFVSWQYWAVIACQSVEVYP
ncbi:unnamed protein product [Rhizoctonia solani]|uniref:Uncharacterized protein n=1 Tax=Rhizoctonia solani TaxID=456999 RepID=A0A8H3GS09_9AGAM|nr:unnamed protein product [Rhizoctonia solani]